MIASSYQTFRIQDVSLHVCCRAAPQPASGKTLTLLTDDDTTQPPQQKDDLLGLDVWPASLALADHLLTHHREFAGQCIELGAGTGVPGVLLATQRAQRVVLTDYEEHVLKLLRKTIAVNRVGTTCSACRLDWSNLHDLSSDLRHAFDLVLAADVVYTSAAAQPCADAIDAVLADDGAGELLLWWWWWRLECQHPSLHMTQGLRLLHIKFAMRCTLTPRPSKLSRRHTMGHWNASSTMCALEGEFCTTCSPRECYCCCCCCH